jgi:GDP-D-mannose dehydratase
MASLMEVPSVLLGVGDVSMREDEVPWLVGAPDKIQSELGWKAEYDLENGLQDSLGAMSAG